MARSDPFRIFRFRVEFNQVAHGAFTRDKGMMRETKVESYREGGVNDYEHKLATLTSYGNIVLERGMLDSYLWDWHQQVIDRTGPGGGIERRSLTLVLNDEADQERWRWMVEGAYPIKSSVTDFDAANSQVLFESIELVHHGLRRLR